MLPATRLEVSMKVRLRLVAPVLFTLVVAPFGHAAPPTPTSPTPAAAPSEPWQGFPGQWAAPPADWHFPVWPSGCGRFDGPERASCLDFVARDFGRLSRFAAANAALAPPAADERRVVFFGDSITDGWASGRFGAFFPGRPYVNRGIGGQTTSQMLLRYRADVIDLEPRVVVILAGTNDISGNSGPTSLPTVQGNLATLAELAQTHGIKVVLSTLLPVCDCKQDEKGAPRIQTKARPPEAIQALNAWIHEYARAKDHVVLDYFPALADQEGRLRPELTGDGLHPNTAGYAVMAPLAEAAIAAALRPR
jgi:acyl-CoA thioesterase I